MIHAVTGLNLPEPKMPGRRSSQRRRRELHISAVQTNARARTFVHSEADAVTRLRHTRASRFGCAQFRLYDDRVVAAAAAVASAVTTKTTTEMRAYNK